MGTKKPNLNVLLVIGFATVHTSS